MIIHTTLPAVCACLALGLVSGCGGDPNIVPVFPTTGTLSMGGEPFGPTIIQLHPVEEGGRMVVGEVDEQGKVTFTTFDRGDGVPAGEYRVLVATKLGAPPRPFPKVYRDREASPLMVTITESEKNELSMEMNPQAGPLVRASPAAKTMGAAQLPTQGSETEAAE